ncbi:Si-specific NAD(P)(+) transhydrogenase [Nitrospira sp. CMX1]|nr:Si-specific NAD(P)(+) transhydrogenase [Nitrospira sp.]MBS0165706.1 Si-specific NAD(P)(+) transhydrogenase [Nitrospira sp.]
MPQDYDFDLLCIGSGPSGQRAAIQAAKFGKRVAVVERWPIVGGVCVATGTIPSKTFREAVLSFIAEDHRFDEHVGQHLNSRPTADQLMRRVGAVIQREAQVVEAQLWRNEVLLLRGEATFTGPHTVLVTTPTETRTVTADKILLAVGTQPVIPRGVSADGELVLTSAQIKHLKHLPRRMAVVGAGVIGIEYASMFAALQLDVTVIDKRDRPLEFIDGEIVDELMHQLRSHEVTFRLGEAVERLELREGPPREVVIHLESGKVIVSDLVLFSAGREGATTRLNLPAAGLTADSRGLVTVDSQFRTAVPHILAAGDVIGYPSLAATSAEQGRLAAHSAFGVESKPMAAHFPVGIYSIPEISMVGAHEHELTAQKVPYETGVARYREIARGQILGDDSGLVKLLFRRDTHRLLGVHAIGTGATELIHIGQAVLGLGAGLDYFLETVFNYPTLAECYKVAALNASNKLAMTASWMPKEAT